MSPLQRAFGPLPLAPSVRRAVGRAAARLALRLRRKPARLVEAEMPAWLLRDLGFRDGRDGGTRREFYD